MKLCLGIYVNDIAVLTQKEVPTKRTTLRKEHRKQSNKPGANM
jgi:hypothetical protein